MRGGDDGRAGGPAAGNAAPRHGLFPHALDGQTFHGQRHFVRERARHDRDGVHLVRRSRQHREDPGRDQPDQRQLRPGTPSVYGSFLTNTDMQSGSPAFGTPESAMGILASAQMARHYNVPFRGGGALTSSKAPDAQAAYESMMCMWPTILGRVNFVLHAAGWLESALLASYEKFVIDVEQLRMFEWILNKGLPVDEEGLAMDALREVGPGGHFLGAEHTLRNYRTGFYRPWISSTENFDRWNRFGARTADVVAAEKWKQLLAEYPDPGIDPGIDEQLQEFMTRRKGEIGES
ncbi:MAG: hypothetical protein E6I35_09335 [Chloroflexi bacterium]|nr:MAG: hypothetical protein E6I35_09335 [Chloroflexota bacterium]